MFICTRYKKGSKIVYRDKKNSKKLKMLKL